jgi:RND family efflux transporter MFP subunit
MNMMRSLVVSFLIFFLGVNVMAESDSHDHAVNEHQADEKNEHDEGEHQESEGAEKENFVTLTPEMLVMGGIKVAVILPVKSAKLSIEAPGEIVNNLYKTSVIGVQLNSKVLDRNVVLGQHIKKGDLIATLFSSEMAELQQSLLLAVQELERVKMLGEKTVGNKRYAETFLAFESINSKIQFAGMSEHALKVLLKGDANTRLGEYQIYAPHEGVVLEDHFQQGQYLSFGDSLITLVNEDELWVDALIAPKVGQDIPQGTEAEVIVDGKIFSAIVIQENHAIDEITRTRKIRLKISNDKHLLHSGQFAEVKLQLPLKGEVMLVPESALMRSSDGDWVVFVEGKSGQFEPLEVELINTSNGMHIVEGLKAGQRVAVEGAFFVASELAKGGFDPHNH